MLLIILSGRDMDKFVVKVMFNLCFEGLIGFFRNKMCWYVFVYIKIYIRIK